MTEADNKIILTLNGGSSSIKFSVYKNERRPVQVLSGKIERIGLNDAVLSYNEININQKNYYLVMDALERLPQLGDTCSYLKQEMQDKLIEHKIYIRKNGEDMPEIRNWKWQSITKDY
jgi:phosphoketolase